MPSEDENEQPEQVELLSRSRTQSTRRQSTEPMISSMTITIILSMSTALIPTLLGTLFYLSLGLNSPEGYTYSNHTFVRPTYDGLTIGGASLSPLLISSISSTVIGDLGTIVMSLLAFHLAYRWLRASRAGAKFLPPPYQFFLMLHMVSHASPWSFVRFAKYAIWRNPSPSASASTMKKRRQREPLTSLLLATTIGLTLVLLLSVGIKVVDIALHDGIISTVIFRNGTTIISGRTTVSAGCGDLSVWACPVLNRSSEASSGGRNDSDILAVYEVPYTPNSPSIAFVGPVVEVPTISATGPTVAVSSNCSIGRLVCDVANDIAYNCASDDLAISLTSLNTTSWQNRAQIFLVGPQNLTGGDKGISSGTSRTPMTVAGMMSFSDYSDISYDDYNRTFDPPFVNWWMVGPGIGNKPYQLTFAFACEISVYDAKYTLSDGAISLQPHTLSRANASTTLAVSSSLVWLGRPGVDTSGYAYASRFIDEQVQVDITTAGNTYGNDTARFSAALGQSLSNRLAGWSAGAVTMEHLYANLTNPILATSIPLVTAGLFAVLHIVYVLGILALGVTCLFLPTTAFGKTSEPAQRATDDASEEGELWKSVRPHPSELVDAQQRLSDAATLVYEVVERNAELSQLARSDEGCVVEGDGREGSVDDSQRPPSLRSRASSLSVAPLLSSDDRDAVRLGLRSDSGGNLHLLVQPS